MNRRDLGLRVALSLGLLLLGLALGVAISLAWMQDAAIAAGALPEPGTPITTANPWQESPIWQTAKAMQTLANGSGIIGALLLLVYGVGDVYTDDDQEVS